MRAGIADSKYFDGLNGLTKQLKNEERQIGLVALVFFVVSVFLLLNDNQLGLLSLGFAAGNIACLNPLKNVKANISSIKTTVTYLVVDLRQAQTDLAKANDKIVKLKSGQANTK